MPLAAASTNASTAWPATMASKALPPERRILSAAIEAWVLMDVTAYCVPRTIGFIVCRELAESMSTLS